MTVKNVSMGGVDNVRNIGESGAQPAQYAGLGSVGVNNIRFFVLDYLYQFIHSAKIINWIDSAHKRRNRNNFDPVFPGAFKPGFNSLSFGIRHFRFQRESVSQQHLVFTAQFVTGKEGVLGRTAHV